MVRRGTSATAHNIAIGVSRFGHDTVPVSVPEGSTVADALKKAGIALEGRETAFISGAEVDMTDQLDEGDVIAIVTPKKAGSN